MISFTVLMQELARRGHQVTVISSFPLQTPIANHTDIVVRDTFPEKESGNTFTDYKNSGGILMMIGVLFFWDIGVKACDRALRQPDIQKLINDNDPQFDLIIFENFVSECFYGFVHKYKVPVINVSPTTAGLFMGDPVGNPYTPSYVPDIQMGYSDHMTFSERVVNILFAGLFTVGRRLLYLHRHDALVMEHFKDPTFPGVSALEPNASLLLVNSHVSLSFPRPFTPNTIEVGGMHIKAAKKLPKDLQQFMDSAKHGVIYFSLGSNVRSSDMPPELLETFLMVFSKLKQQVLWKWEKDSLPGQPANVRLGKWLPQTDILAHPNLKLFITHGGLLSTQEAIYRQVPMLAIPIMADQRSNANRATAAGYALMLETENITVQSLSWALSELLNNPSYQEKVKWLSALFRDQQQSPLEKAVYWTEYVLRHNGAPHLRSAALDLYWYQYYLLDVLAVLLVVPMLLLAGLILLCRTVCFRKRQQTSMTKKKKN
ncbi:UDP-glycosyltransferase UGT5 [Anabrus simplex]|uniref:UDP-glycosyltransferase UGT5 n=1 Tax=Anabrus simplex TaxID=316456 RepID=UPI0035A358D0